MKEGRSRPNTLNLAKMVVLKRSKKRKNQGGGYIVRAKKGVPIASKTLETGERNYVLGGEGLQAPGREYERREQFPIGCDLINHDNRSEEVEHTRKRGKALSCQNYTPCRESWHKEGKRVTRRGLGIGVKTGLIFDEEGGENGLDATEEISFVLAST